MRLQAARDGRKLYRTLLSAMRQAFLYSTRLKLHGQRGTPAQRPLARLF